MAQQADGKLVLGGKFTASHGLARRNIARVDIAGKPDPTFNPGTGFDGAVRSLAIRPDGMIWAGGNFTKYNNNDSMGVALIRADGTYVGVTALPETSAVNWVGVSGFTLYVAGSFGKIGGIPCGNIAALDLNGNLSSTFVILPGTNASINTSN